MEALLLDEACGEVDPPFCFSQVDGANNSPNVSQGKEVEVEGSELKEMERPMKGWSQVRRKNSQEEKEVAAMTRGWEEFKSAFPYLAHTWRYAWSESEVTRQEVRGDMERRRGKLESKEKEMVSRAARQKAEKKKVEEWLQEGGKLG